MAMKTQEHRPPLDVTSAATYCGIQKGYLNKLRVSGGGPIFINLGKKILYSPDDLDAWLDSKKFKSTSQYER